MTSTAPAAPPLYGVMAEFQTADELIDATRRAVEAGYTRLDGYSPYPLGEVADHLGFPRSEIGAVMFIGGVAGAVFGFGMQSWISVIDYPISIGGKPYWSWPQYVPIAWALLVLTASLSGVFGLLALCGLPQPYHPVFNVDRFRRATRDRFFLCVEAADPLFEPGKVKAFLATLNPDDVAEVPE